MPDSYLNPIMRHYRDEYVKIVYLLFILALQLLTPMKGTYVPSRIVNFFHLWIYILVRAMLLRVWWCGICNKNIPSIYWKSNLDVINLFMNNHLELLMFMIFNFVMMLILFLWTLIFSIFICDFILFLFDLWLGCY